MYSERRRRRAAEGLFHKRRPRFYMTALPLVAASGDALITDGIARPSAGRSERLVMRCCAGMQSPVLGADRASQFPSQSQSQSPELGGFPEMSDE